jgi:DNA invertase Pin-like site-specific DNA recombinase
MTKNKAILFVRVSTEQQDYNRQIDDLTHYAETKGLNVVGTIAEKISGAADNSKRPGIKELLQRAKKKEFDAIVITEISRLGRKAIEMQKLIEELSSMKVCIYIQSHDIKTLDSNGKRTPLVDFLIDIFLHLGQMERHFLQERIRSGLTRARAQGRVGGRPKGSLSNQELLKKYPKVVRDIKSGLSIRQIEKLHDISHTTVMKVKKAML